MKPLLAVGLVAIFSAAALAQHRSEAPPAMGQSSAAAGGALPIVNPFSGPAPFAQRLGSTISGFPSYTGASSGSGRHGSRRHGYVGYASYGG